MQISYDNGRFEIVFSGKRLYFAPASVGKFEGGSLEFGDYTVTQKKDLVTARAENGGFAAVYSFTGDSDFLRVAFTLENKLEDTALGVTAVAREISSESFEFLDTVLVTGENMIGVEGIRPFDRDRESAAFAGLTDKYGNGAFLIGFTDNRRERHLVNTYFESKTLSAVAYRDGTVLKKGGKLEFNAFVLGFDKSLNKLLSGYGDLLARDSEAIVPKELETGWCDWYYYYSYGTDSDLLNAAKTLKESPIGDKIRYIQADDGWEHFQNGPGHNWGDWHAGFKFPMGMKHFADSVHEMGYKAGVWLAPFTVSKISELYKQHPDWAVTDGSSETLGAVDYPLDLSNPAVTEFVRETFERVFNEWGFDYIKIDFIGMAMSEGKRFAREKTIAAYYHDTLRMIKEIAGDRHVLTCGPSIYQTIGATDSIRIGPDVGNRWVIPLDWGDQVGGNCSIKPCLNNTLRRNWMHNRLWHNDPDCMMAREKRNEFEQTLYGKDLFGVPWSDEVLGIDDVTFDSWSKAIWFMSLPNILSEIWEAVPERRRARLSEMYDCPNRKLGYVDWYADREIVILKTEDDGEGRPQMLAVFNMSDKPFKAMLPAEVTGGLEWSYKEEFGEGGFEGRGGMLELPEVVPHGARIFTKISGADK